MFSTAFTFMKSVSSGPPPPPVEQLFTSNGTWSCCPGAKCIEVIAVGGGGAGRSYTNVANCPTNPGRATGGPGGGAGEVKICTLTSGFGSSQCVIIGPGGSSNNPGSASCFGALVIASGGAVGNTPICINGTGFSSVTAGAAVGGSPVGGNSQACSANFGSVTPYLPQNAGCPGGSATGKPGGGGGGGGYSACMFGYWGCGGVGGVGGTICGITLGTGGTGGCGCNGSGQTIAIGGAAVGYGAGGGGAASSGGYDIGTTRAGGCGGPGVIKVIQYF